MPRIARLEQPGAKLHLVVSVLLAEAEAEAAPPSLGLEAAAARLETEPLLLVVQLLALA